MNNKAGVRKNSKAIKVCGFAAVINDPMPIIGIHAGAAALLPSPTKCQEDTKEEIISMILSSHLIMVVGNGPPPRVAMHSPTFGSLIPPPNLNALIAMVSSSDAIFLLLRSSQINQSMPLGWQANWNFKLLALFSAKTILFRLLIMMKLAKPH